MLKRILTLAAVATFAVVGLAACGEKKTDAPADAGKPADAPKPAEGGK